MLFFVVGACLGLVGVDFGGTSIAVANETGSSVFPACFAIWSRAFPSRTKPAEHFYYSEIDDIDWAYFGAAVEHEYLRNHVWGIRPLLENEWGLLRRELLALELNQVFNKSTNPIAYVAAPGMSFAERVAVSESMKLANLSLAGVVDGVSAAVAELADAGVTGETVVMRVEGRSTWAAVVRVNDAAELAVSRMEFGAWSDREKVAERLVNTFVAQGPRRMKIDREVAKRTLMVELMGAKAKLAENETMEMFVEELGKGKNFTHQLTREEWEMGEDYVRGKWKDLFKKVVKAAGVTPERIDLIVAEEDAERVKAIVADACKVSNVVVHGDDTLAKGARRVTDAKNALVRSNVALRVGGEVVPLFKEGQKMTETVIIKRKIGEMRQFKVVVDDHELWNGSVTLSGSPDEMLEVTFGFDKLLVPTVLAAVVKGAPVEFDMEADWMMSKNQTIASEVFCGRMWQIEQRRHNMKEAARAFGRHLQSVKNDLDKYKSVMTEADFLQLEVKIQNMIVWTEEKDDPSQADIDKRMAKLAKLTKDVRARLEQVEDGGPAWDLLKSYLDKSFALIQNWRPETATVPKYKVYRLWSVCNTTKEWYDEKRPREDAQVATTKTPSFTYEDIVMRTEMVKKLYNQATEGADERATDEL